MTNAIVLTVARENRSGMDVLSCNVAGCLWRFSYGSRLSLSDLLAEVRGHYERRHAHRQILSRYLPRGDGQHGQIMMILSVDREAQNA